LPSHTISWSEISTEVFDETPGIQISEKLEVVTNGLYIPASAKKAEIY